MIAELAPFRSTPSPGVAEDLTDLADVAFMWATLNALDCVEVATSDATVVRAVHERFRRRLNALGITSTDLFEHLADAVERGDWGALGIVDEPD